MDDQGEKSANNFVIQACLPRTGSFSMKAALQILLGGESYHCIDDANGYPTNYRVSFWEKLASGHVTTQDIQEFVAIHNYVSIGDCPISFFYKDIIQAFPESKVILTTRDPESWYESQQVVLPAITRLLQSPWQQPGIHLSTYFFNSEKVGKSLASLARSWAEEAGSGKETAIKFYHEFVEDVKKTVPPEKLLVYSVTQGWEPLCAFLNVPIPKEPFPFLNKRVELAETLHQIRKKRQTLYKQLTAIGALLGSIVISLYYSKTLLN